MYWKKKHQNICYSLKNYLVIIVEIHFRGTSRASEKKHINNNYFLKTLIRKVFDARWFGKRDKNLKKKHDSLATTLFLILRVVEILSELPLKAWPILNSHRCSLILIKSIMWNISSFLYLGIVKTISFILFQKQKCAGHFIEKEILKILNFPSEDD